MTTNLVLNNPWKAENMPIKPDGSQFHDIVSSEMLADKLELVKAEINENEKLKEQCLTQLREWLRQNGDIENCPTDDNFLLRFLRIKKYSLFMTQQMILKYLNLRKKFIHFMDILDFHEPKTNELISNGYIFASPFRDSEGRRVIIYNIGKFDLQRFKNVDMGHAHVITYEAVLEDEETQILGVNHIADLSGGTPAFTTLFSITEFTRIVTWGEQSFPMRHKAIHLLNVPSAGKYIYDYALSKMSKKLTQRFVLHDSVSTIVTKVDKNCLPQEFGGIMPMAEMIQLWKEELSAKRERLMSFQNINLLSDKGIISRKTIAEHMAKLDTEGLSGCFRKLEVD